ncbi:phage integrase N-terminal SAM-like domain-containing protein, partial [Coprococcus sp. ART55/1]|uniref:phage integrase N-terminal SAM-like domain-containing protein n=1 Tax=Coprococcus sp. ART55/1 TaxID=751585 RepID=UPI001AD84AE5
MDQEKINIIMSQMADVLDNMQLLQLKKVLEEVDSGERKKDDSEDLLKRFISTKRLEGRSERTLSYYQITIEKMLNSLNKNVRAITTDDLRQYLSDYQES